MTAQYAFIAGEEGHYPIHLMCRWAKVSRSGFYEWRSRGDTATTQRREVLQSQVRFAFDRSDGTYGYRRVHAQLARWGHHYDDETVRVVMRDLGLVPCSRNRSGRPRPSPAIPPACQTWSDGISRRPPPG